MVFDNSQVRRRDRLMDESAALLLLRNAEYGVLSLCGGDGKPYGIPVNHVWDGKSAIYVHCAPEGRKLRTIEENPRVSFCVIGRVNLLPQKFTTEYESIVVEGTAHIGLPEEERMHALRLLISKLSPEFQETGEKYARASFARTAIIRIDIDKISGKRKKIG